MLKKHILTLNWSPDTGLSGASSTPPASAGKPESSTATPPQERSFMEVAREAYDKATAAEGGVKEEEEKSGLETNPDDSKETESLEEEPGTKEVEEKVEGEEATEEEGKEVEGEEKPEDKESDPDAKLPFHEHPRWKEVLTQKKEFETRATQAEQKVKEVEPILKWVSGHQGFMQANGISNDEFANAMNILALQKSDPAKAREALRPLWESLQEYDENYIPPDIQKLVDDNEMTPAAAKMYAKLQAQLKAKTQGSKLTAEQMQMQQQNALTTAVRDWDRSKAASDPDFKQKSKAEDPDGLWEITAANYSLLESSKPSSTPQQVILNLEEAYKRAKGVISRFSAPKKPTPPSPSSMRSSSPPKKKPEDMTVDEVVSSVARRHGIAWNGRHAEE